MLCALNDWFWRAPFGCSQDDGVDNTPPLPLRTFDTTAPSTVLSVGSFSKTLSPGLRVGYIWGADRLTHQIGPP